MLPRNFGSEKIVHTEYVHTYVHPFMLADAKWLNTICIKLGIGHPCCDQLTAVKKEYPLTNVT